jgi:hypothetical protein
MKTNPKDQSYQHSRIGEQILLMKEFDTFLLQVDHGIHKDYCLSAKL